MSKPDELDIAKRRAMHLIAAREYGRNELTAKLREHYSEQTCETVADLMCEYGYIDDARYAEKLARSCIAVKGYGKSRAALMMRRKGLDADTIDEALGKYTDDDITAEIVSILRRKYADRLFLEGDEGRKEMRKIIAALARRGYGYDEIKAALYEVRGGLEDY